MNIIQGILGRIKLPDDVVDALHEELKDAKVKEREYCKREVTKFKTEQEKEKTKLDRLFDMRLNNELDRESFDIKRAEIQVNIDRLSKKIVAHEKADNSFNNTILDLLDIANEASNMFAKSKNPELKRFLLKFVFKKMVLTKEKFSYELNFPFGEFETNNFSHFETQSVELNFIEKKTRGQTSKSNLC